MFRIQQVYKSKPHKKAKVTLHGNEIEKMHTNNIALKHHSKLRQFANFCCFTAHFLQSCSCHIYTFILRHFFLFQTFLESKLNSLMFIVIKLYIYSLFLCNPQRHLITIHMTLWASTKPPVYPCNECRQDPPTS